MEDVEYVAATYYICRMCWLVSENPYASTSTLSNKNTNA